MEKHPHHRHINLLLILAIFLVLCLLLLLKPALLGYKLSKQFEEVGMSVSEFIKKMESLKSELLITETNLDSCKSLNQEYLGTLSKEKNTSFICSQEKNELLSRFYQLQSEYKFNITRIETDFEQRKDEIEVELNQEKINFNELKEMYDSLVENSANNLCCKARVDNKDIDSYILSNDRIVCTTGEKNKISC